MDSPISIARFLAESSDDDVSRAIDELRGSERLFSTIHELNELLGVPEHRDLALKALKRIGLDQAG